VLNNTNIFVWDAETWGIKLSTLLCQKGVVGKRAIALGQLFALPFGYPAMTQEKPSKKVVLVCRLSYFTPPRLARRLSPAQTSRKNEYNRQLIETYNSFASLNGLGLFDDSEQVLFCNGILITNGWWSGCGLSLAHYNDLDAAN